MSPSSRKRNKGKERKAKQLIKKEEIERTDAHRIWKSLCSYKRCDHGCNVMISNDHPVSSFMDQFYINLHHKRMTAAKNIREIFNTHRQVWTNESYRKLAIDILLRIGTNYLLGDEREMSWPMCLANSIIALEQYNGTDNIDLVVRKRVVVSKWRDLEPGVCNIRDALKFYRKRISCKCLKKMHLEARENEPKMGICWHCKEEKERAALSVCSRCMIEQYCSRECQVAGWPCHKEYCDYVKACQDDK